MGVSEPNPVSHCLSELVQVVHTTLVQGVHFPRTTSIATVRSQLRQALPFPIRTQANYNDTPISLSVWRTQ